LVLIFDASRGKIFDAPHGKIFDAPHGKISVASRGKIFDASRGKIQSKKLFFLCQDATPEVRDQFQVISRGFFGA